MDTAKLKRTTPPKVEEVPKEKRIEVTAGSVDKALDLAFNPSRDKIREVTIIDRMQGHLFPILDIINMGQRYIIEIASYRQSPEEYEKVFDKKIPLPPNYLDELMYRTAQWQKSVMGANLTKITDIALAEMEAKAGEEEEGIHGDPFRD